MKIEHKILIAVGLILLLGTVGTVGLLYTTSEEADNIVNDLKNKYEKSFGQEDSVIIFKLSSSCEVLRFGYAKNDEKDFLSIT